MIVIFLNDLNWYNNNNNNNNLYRFYINIEVNKLMS